MTGKARTLDRMAFFLGAATFFWSMLFVWQGLDFTDMGAWLTGYQQFYTNLDMIRASCWLSCFIGHWIGLALGGMVISYKLGHAAIITLSAIVAYHVLSSQLGRSRKTAGLVFLTVLFTRIYGGNWLGYYELTALFYLMGAALLFYGLTINRVTLLVLAGIVLGANIFVRFPNILGLSLVSTIWLQAWNKREPWKDAFAKSMWFLGGCMLGVATIWGLIILCGHKSVYYQAIQGLFGAAADLGSGHSVLVLLTRCIRDHFRAFAEALFILIILGRLSISTNKCKKWIVSVVIVACALSLFYFFYLKNQWQWSVTGILYVLLLMIVFMESKRASSKALLAFISGLVLFLTPLGSGDGLNLSPYGMWLALPLSLAWLHGGVHSFLIFGSKPCVNDFGSRAEPSHGVCKFRLVATVILLALLMQSLISAWRYTYRDSPDRCAMTHTIAHPLLVGTFTTAERAKVVAELLDAMSVFTKPGDDVLAYHSITTVHYLTATRPWLGHIWPDMLTGDAIEARIRQRERSGARLPCIVRAKGSTWTSSWPSEAMPPNWLHLDESISQRLEEFIRRHRYVLSWSNDFFEILTPIPTH